MVSPHAAMQVMVDVVYLSAERVTTAKKSQFSTRWGFLFFRTLRCLGNKTESFDQSNNMVTNNV